MELSYWISRWNKGNIGFHMENEYPGLEQYWDLLKMLSEPIVLVPLAGKSKDVYWISKKVGKVVAVELSKVAIKQFFEEHQLKSNHKKFAGFDIYTSGNIEYWCGNFLKFPLRKLPDVDLIYDKGSIIALPPAMRKQFSEKLHDLSSPKTKILMHILSYNQLEMNGPPFSVNLEEIESLFGYYFEKKVLNRSELNLLDYKKFQLRGMKSPLFEYLLLLSRKKSIY
ncbi:MAG: hypothetical protein WD513_06660 [Balneolaceae bacterium]